MWLLSRLHRDRSRRPPSPQTESSRTCCLCWLCGCRASAAELRSPRTRATRRRRLTREHLQVAREHPRALVHHSGGGCRRTLASGSQASGASAALFHSPRDQPVAGRLAGGRAGGWRAADGLMGWRAGGGVVGLDRPVKSDERPTKLGTRSALAFFVLIRKRFPSPFHQGTSCPRAMAKPPPVVAGSHRRKHSLSPPADLLRCPAAASRVATGAGAPTNVLAGESLGANADSRLHFQ